MSISVEQKFKVGDRVKVLKSRGGADWQARVVGKEGTIYEIRSHNTVRAHFENGLNDYGLTEGLELITAPTPRTITLDGVTYTLTPVQEQAEEVKREPQEGEVWKNVDGNRHFLICTGDKAVDISGIVMGIGADELKRQGCTFAYPTLRAAFEAGAL